MQRTRLAVVASAAAAALALAPLALAGVDDLQVTFSRTVETTNGVGTGSAFRGKILVEGSGIERADVTFPDKTRTPLEADPNHFVLELPFATQAELDAGLPPGDYSIALVTADDPNGTYKIPYEVPAVASPAITSPRHRSAANVPGSTQFGFSACGKGCSGDTTSVTLELASDPEPPVEEDLAFDSQKTSWEPAADLLPTTEYVFRVVHSGATTEILGTADAFTFVNRSTVSDQVGFATGSLPPLGSLCMVMNDPNNLLHTPSEGCTVFENPRGAIYDPSGTLVSTRVGMIDVEYEFVFGPKGRVTGRVAHADIDGDGDANTTVPVRGRIRGWRGHIRQKIKIRIRNAPPAPEANLKMTFRERIQVIDGDEFQRTTSEKLRGKHLGAKVGETTTFTEVVAGAPLGWRLDFTIEGSGGSDGRTLDVSGARLRLMRATEPDGFHDVPLVAKGRYSPVSNRSKLGFRASGVHKGIRARIRDLRIRDGVVTTIRISVTAIGQRARVNQVPPD